MPRIAEFKYTKLTGKLLDLLRRAPNLGRPEKVNETWLRSVGCASSDPKSIIRVLRFVNLIGSDDIPTDLWDTIREPSRQNRIRFAEAVRSAYSELFRLYRDAHRKDDQALKDVFQGRGGIGQVAQQAALATFRTLVQFGDFDSAMESSVTRVIELPEFLKTVVTLETDSRHLLLTYELIQSRVKSLEPILERLDELNLEQSLLLHESVLAAQAGLFRASHVLAWIDFSDYLSKLVAPDTGSNSSPDSVDDEPRRPKDIALINIGRRLRLYNEATKKVLEGLLNDRNQCAHPSEYNPNLNDTMTFLGRLIGVMEALGKQPIGV
jgi:hypothetical protein